MKSRGRVLASINHKQPDRVPIDLGSSPNTGISAVAYHNLKKFLGITTGNTRIHDVLLQLAIPEEEILNLFQVDVIDLGHTFNLEDEKWYNININGIQAQFPTWFRPNFNSDGSLDVVHSDGTILASMSKNSLVLDQTYFPCKEKYPTNMKDLITLLQKNYGYACVSPPFSYLNQKDFWKTLRKNALELRNNTDRAIVMYAGFTLFQFGATMKPMDKFLIDLIRRPQDVEKFLDLMMEIYFISARQICKWVGDVVDIICFGDDFGENNGPIMSPRIFHKFFKPRHAQLIDYIKKNSKMKTFLHSCGSVIDLIPDFIEIGFDILNPVQINCHNMDPKDLKKNFGDDITFWGGGADSRNVINRKNPEQVKKHVKELLEIFSPGGGYVFNTIHNIMADVPPENIVAIFEAINEFNNQI
ncbi:MAG: methyltransferase [Promethearchaeota archaeon]|nr:MAG: methyltransferase [Candidatus Lokiarchaeota archaeon]